MYRSLYGLFRPLWYYKVPLNIFVSCSLIRPFCAVKEDLYRIFENSDSNDLLKAKQVLYTDKKENQLFLIYKEIQSVADAKSYI
jgi:hypothetical protein